MPIGATMQSVINAGYFREKVQMCLRLAKILPWNDPVRYQLLLMAEDFQKQETELENAGFRMGSDLLDKIMPFLLAAFGE
jgi:hypothetical protein